MIHKIPTGKEAILRQPGLRKEGQKSDQSTPVCSPVNSFTNCLRVFILQPNIRAIHFSSGLSWL